MLLICYKTTVEKLCIKLIKVKYFKCRSVIFVEFFLGLRSTIACFQEDTKTYSSNGKFPINENFP